MAQALAGRAGDRLKVPTSDDLKSPGLWLTQAHAMAEAAKIFLRSEPNLESLPVFIRGACDSQYFAVGMPPTLVRFHRSMVRTADTLMESQRVAVAAKLANMAQGERTDKESSANFQKVSQAAAKVQQAGVPELAAALERWVWAPSSCCTSFGAVCRQVRSSIA